MRTACCWSSAAATLGLLVVFEIADFTWVRQNTSLMFSGFLFLSPPITVRGCGHAS